MNYQNFLHTSLHLPSVIFDTNIKAHSLFYQTFPICHKAHNSMLILSHKILWYDELCVSWMPKVKKERKILNTFLHFHKFLIKIKSSIYIHSYSMFKVKRFKKIIPLQAFCFILFFLLYPHFHQTVTQLMMSVFLDTFSCHSKKSYSPFQLIAIQLIHSTGGGYPTHSDTFSRSLMDMEMDIGHVEREENAFHLFNNLH